MAEDPFLPNMEEVTHISDDLVMTSGFLTRSFPPLPGAYPPGTYPPSPGAYPPLPGAYPENCRKRKHTGRLDLPEFLRIAAVSMDSNLDDKEKVKQIMDQVLKGYATLEARKASRNLPSAPGLSFEMPTGDGHLFPTSPIQQLSLLRQALYSGMDWTMQGQGSQHGTNTHNGVDFTNSGCFLQVRAETPHKLLDAYKQQVCLLKAQMSRMKLERVGWEVKFLELEGKYSELEQKYLELECENGLLKHPIMQSQLPTLHQEQEQKYSELEYENGLLKHPIMQSQLPTLHQEQEQKYSELECENGLLKHPIMQSQLPTLHLEQELDLDMLLSMGHE